MPFVSRRAKAMTRPVLLLVLTLGVVCALASMDTAAANHAGSDIPCQRLESFDAADFPDEPEVDNEFLPLVPGAQRVFEGDVDGVPHRVTFTVTDLTKVINGVRSFVIWDVDESEGAVEESELAFFAQDRAGNVWNLGEYPEEFDNRKFAGAPNTWIAGQEDAEAGIHMAAEPQLGGDFYLQGIAPAIDFLDCGKVVELGATVDVPAGHFEDVLVTNETDPNVPADGIQVKSHAPGIGIVKIGFALPGAAPESLELVSARRLGKGRLAVARAKALRLDRRAYVNTEVYDATSPAAVLDDDDDDDDDRRRR